MYCSQSIHYTIRPGDTLHRLALHYNTTVPSIVAQNPGLNPYNLIVGSRIIICPGDSSNMNSGSPNISEEFNPATQSLTNDMRKAWSQHVYWTRMLLISIAERLEDQSAVTDRLLQNPKDIANIFANYYDEDVANLIEELLTEHLQIGAELITALRDEKNEEADRLKWQWYTNANEMAGAFASISPFYDEDELREMLYNHLNLTTKEVAMRLAKNYPADIEAFEEVEAEALAMADYFTSGIIQQFPQEFH